MKAFVCDLTKGRIVLAALLATVTSILLGSEASAQPANDSFAGASAIQNLPFSDSPNTIGATVEAGEDTIPSCFPFGELGATVWYRFNTATSLNLIATTGSGDFQPLLVIYRGTSLATLTEIGCGSGSVEFSVSTGETYYFQIGGAFGANGAATFSAVASDIDTDGDGTADSLDPDDDNDSNKPPAYTACQGPCPGGFNRDAAEDFVGTSRADRCADTTAANDEADDKWPPDFDDNRVVNVADFALWKAHFPAPNTNDPKYNRRFDLDANGAINVADFTAWKAYFPQSCEPDVVPLCFGVPPTIVGTPSSDLLTGTDQDDVIVGLGGDDQVNGGGGRDRVCGGNGNDAITAGGGIPNEFENYDDQLSGGAGNDQIQGGEGIDLVVGDEGNDQLFGGLDNDRIEGGSGEDVVDGDEGDDELLGGPGFDQVVGDIGFDAASYADHAGAVSANLATGRADSDGWTDELSGIESLEGGSGPDTLTGDESSNSLFGGEGGDTLRGGGGSDALLGGAGIDNLDAGGGLENVLLGGPGDDTLAGGDGDDFLFGEAGNDTLQSGAGSINQLEGGPDNDQLTGGPGIDAASFASSGSAVKVDLLAGTATGEGTDILQSIDSVIGSILNDTLRGDEGSNLFLGLQGDDALLGFGGSDGFLPAEGDDVITGGDGSDLLAFFSATGPVVVDLGAGTVTGEGTDAVNGIELLDGSGFDDSLTGDGNINVIAGNAGNDVINGAGGLDFAAYDFSPAAIVANLGASTASGDGADGLQGIEGIFGSDFNDDLTGDAADNFLFGGLGDDRLDGAGGSDELHGEDGFDTCLNGEVVVGCESFALVVPLAQAKGRIDLRTLSIGDELRSSMVQLQREAR